MSLQLVYQIVIGGLGLVALLALILVLRKASRWWQPEAPTEPRRTAADGEMLTSGSGAYVPEIGESQYVSQMRESANISGLSIARKPDPGLLPTIEPAEVPVTDRSDYSYGGLTPILASLLPESATRKAEIKRELTAAGYHQPHAAQNLAASRYLGIIIPLLLMGVLLVIVPPQLEMVVIIGFSVMALLGWALPRLFVRSRAEERKLEIERSMPDVLDMLNMCVSQGMTLGNALQRVNIELKGVYPALSQELQIVADQARVGSLEHALRNFSARVDVPDVHSFTSLLIQTERMGTSVSTALGSYAENMRSSLQQRADEKANRATFRLLFPTVLCLMPAVYLFLLGPSVVELSDFFKNRDRILSRNLVESNNE